MSDFRNSSGSNETSANNNDKGNPKWTRRQFLKNAGAAVFALSFGGLIWRAVDQGVFSTGKGPAYELWSMDELSQMEGPMALVHSAVLASNPHNSQPWLFKVSDSSIELYADFERGLGTMDPFYREMDIGLGCALENMLLAAEANGYAARLTYYPEPFNPSFAAKIELKAGEKISSRLYEAIPERYTHRGPYDTDRVVSDRLLQDIEELCKSEPGVKLYWLTESEQMRQAGELTIAATEAIIGDAEMSHDSNKWYRDNWKELQTHRDGLTLDAQGGSAGIRAAGKILPPVSHETANRFWLNSTRQTHVPTAAAYGMLAVSDYSSKEERLRAGRLWQRIQLKGTVEGLAMHPLNQLMEMRDREMQLGSSPPHYGEQLRLLSPDPRMEVIFLFRLGYAVDKTFPSPRRAVEDVII